VLASEAEIATIARVAAMFAISCLLSLATLSPTQLARAASLQSAHDSRAPVSARSGQRSGQEKAALDRAMAALQRNDLKEAEREARAALTAAPRSAVSHNVLGGVLDRSGDPDPALVEFNLAIEIDPGYLAAHNNLGRVLAQNGKVAQAVVEFENVLKIEPKHVQAHFNLGSIYAGTGQYAKAADHFAAARAENPDDP